MSQGSGSRVGARPQGCVLPSVEVEVGNALATFGDRATAVATQVMSTMLASVAAVIGSFIGAALSDKFNDTIFVLGMWIYAGYVVVFPGLFGLWSQHAQYEQALRHYELRRANFDVVLGSARIMTIEAGRIEPAKDHYRWTFGIAIVAYVGIAIGSLVAADLVPDHVAATSGSPIPTTTTSISSFTTSTIP